MFDDIAKELANPNSSVGSLSFNLDAISFSGKLPSACSLLLLLVAYFACSQAFCQDLEPRRWTVLPAGINVLAAGYARIEGDVAFDPVLEVENATVQGNILALSYIRSFKVADAVLRLDATLPWQQMRWDGLLNGEPASVSRTGFGDPTLRLSIILLDSAEQQKPDSASTTGDRRTVVGAAISTSLPLGEYTDARLLNLGQNRFVLRPQAGVVHTRGPWSFELTGSAFLFSKNDEFFDGNTRKQDPLYAAQAHVVRLFKPGLWASVGMAYAFGGESSVSGTRKDDDTRQFLSGFSAGFPISKRLGLKFAYVRSRSNVNVGSDTDSGILAFSTSF